MKEDRDMAFVRQVLDPAIREKTIKNLKRWRIAFAIFAGIFMGMYPLVRDLGYACLNSDVSIFFPLLMLMFAYHCDTQITLALVVAELQKSNSNTTPQQGDKP